MDVEKTVLRSIPYLLKRFDRSKKGITLDIGVGTFNFYFEVFAKNNYKTYAFEPLPTIAVKDLCKKNNVHLLEVCVYDFNGTIEIFTGRYKENDLLDVSSVNSDWWGIDSKSEVKLVNTITLETFINENSVENISYLKIDTEGSEWIIIKQLSKIKQSSLPKIIEFEYGGGSERKEGIAGWSPNYFSKTINCISTLIELNYRFAILYERANEKIQYIDLDNRDLILSDIFKDNFVYGNLIFCKEKRFSEWKLNRFVIN